MNWGRIWALNLRQLFLMRRSFARITDLFYWPLLDLFFFGFLSLYLGAQDRVPLLAGLLLGALILWDIFFRVQQAISVSFLTELWTRNLVNIFVTPLTVAEFVVAMMLWGLIKISVTVTLMTTAAFLLYHFNIFVLGVSLIPLVTALIVFAWAIGTVITAVILRYGQSAETLAWSLAFLFQPFGPSSSRCPSIRHGWPGSRRSCRCHTSSRPCAPCWPGAPCRSRTSSGRLPLTPPTCSPGLRSSGTCFRRLGEGGHSSSCKNRREEVHGGRAVGVSGGRNIRRGSAGRWGVLWLAIVVATQPVLPVTAGATRFDTRHGGRKAMSSVVQFERASIWSLHVTSQSLLADYGYATEYTFEFLDEEELLVQGLGQQEIISGRVLTILDGELVEAEIQLRGEPMPLLINSDGYRLVAAWRRPDRLVPTELPPEEIARRLKVLSDLRAETRRRLGLATFRPSRDARVSLRIAAVDTIAMVPADDARQRYEVRQPMTAATTEVLVREADGRRWEITWGAGVLQVQLTPVLTTLKTTVSYQEGQATGRVGQGVPLRPTDAAQIAATAFEYLQAARRYFGTVSMTAPLPGR